MSLVMSLFQFAGDVPLPQCRSVESLRRNVLLKAIFSLRVNPVIIGNGCVADALKSKSVIVGLIGDT
jgi:hypothetical protein